MALKKELSPMEWDDLTHFEGNANAFRILTHQFEGHEQAEDYGHSFEREMGFLAVHGFLHINGYDHYTPEEEAEMFGLQEEILTAYGLTRQ